MALDTDLTPTAAPARVVATEAALALIAQLQREHGKLMFYQSHGCCDGSTPMCFVQGEMALTAADVQLGTVGGVPFHAGAAQFEYLEGSELTLDVAPGSLGTFSLEDPLDRHFVVRTRLWTAPEWQALQRAEGRG